MHSTFCFSNVFIYPLIKLLKLLLSCFINLFELLFNLYNLLLSCFIDMHHKLMTYILGLMLQRCSTDIEAT